MKIYTRTGDDGTTSLYSGERVAKTHPRIEACGTIDELNSQLGAAVSASPALEVGKSLLVVQEQLFTLGADLATPHRLGGRHIARISHADAAWLESRIDEMSGQLPILRQFILPGGTQAASHIHIARATSRRAERLIVAAHEENFGAHILPYLNRLSDFLFTLARFENFLSGVPEAKWEPRS